jgi:chemotaxis protein MotA
MRKRIFKEIDKGSVAGAILAATAIAGGMVLEGGRIAQILQPTAAMVVFGGTLGAVMLSFPLPLLIASLKQIIDVFRDNGPDYRQTIETLVRFCNKARREGILALDGELPGIENPFLHRAMMLAIDGTEPNELRKMMVLEMDLQSERDEDIPRVFEAAGGYSPTVGILGAVLGLIQVMQHLDNIEEVGKGIAVAFVATIYGVALANLFCLPAAAKLKTRAQKVRLVREMMLEGVVSMLEGINPRVLEMKLGAFLDETDRVDPIMDPKVENIEPAPAPAPTH